ncbi:MAG TPA: hypothetical protein VGU19_09395 [Microvirga sp.]|jgi:hypothetical protein|nr:hypothetical protein [Microvirga sp.]
MGVFRTLMAAGFALAGAITLQTAPAEAQRGWGRYQGDYYAPHGLRQRYYAPRYYGGARSVYYGPRRYYGYGPRRYYGYGYPYGYYRRPNYGGAVAAGVIGGLALGAIASAAANPYYGPGYYRPAYYAPPRCVFERRRVVNPYGRVVVRRIRTCY